MKKQIVVIGGGTGTHTLLRGLKQYQKTINLTAIVTMADSGGSTGRLRDEFGQLPVGDVRMALTALARSNGAHDHLLRELFLYRFNRGDGLSGHNFGNLLLVALTDILGNEEAAIAAAGKILAVDGQVIPVTTTASNLVAIYDDGVKVIGEHAIDEPAADRLTHTITTLKLQPAAEISASAEAAILDADLIVIGPGDLYTSLLANLVVDGVSEAIQHAGARVVFVCNLMTKAGQTTNYDVAKHCSVICNQLSRPLDTVLVNSGTLPPELMERYAEEGEYPVAYDMSAADTHFVGGDWLAKEAVKTAAGDRLKRRLVRHDSRRLARVLVSLLP